MMKRIFYLGALLLCLACVILPAQAAIVDSGTCGNNLTWTLTDDGALTISGRWGMDNYAPNNRSPWASHVNNIKTVRIEQGVTSIGNYAFLNCKNLSSITIPESVTSIGNGGFAGCRGLASITIPENVMNIGDEAFEDCSSLTSINIPESVTNIGEEVFYYCSSLTSITIPESVTNIGDNAFYGCSSLTSITIPESVTNIGDEAFNGCSGLNSITIPESVTSIGDEAFAGCSSLNSITIPEGVTSIGSWTFNGCSGLASITIPESVTNIGDGAFNYCESLTSITIPKSVTNIGDRAFNGCSGLTQMTVLATTPPVAVGYAFYNVSRDIPVYVPEKSLMAYQNDGLWNLFNLQGIATVIESGTCGNNLTWTFTDDGTMTIRGTGEMNNYKYYNNSPWASHANNIKTARIEQGVTSIGDYAFSGCSNLNSITIPESVTSIGEGTFYECFDLVSISIPNGATSIKEEAFGFCESLISITIPESVTSIGDYAFEYCRSLTTINIPENVTSIGKYAFLNCSRLTQMTVLATTPPTVIINTFVNVSRDIPVYVPEESLTAYQNADVWKEFNLQALSSTGLHKPVLPESIRVYDGLLHNPQGLSVRLYDMQGSLVYSGTATVLSMPAGVYVLQCGKANGKVTFP